MNLTLNPWIPIIGADGRQRSVSMQDLFASAQEIRDLAVKPHEKIALLRLLICITQAALDGPKDSDAWETCCSMIPSEARRYLNRPEICAAFELFGEGPRFLQVPGLKSAKEEASKVPATKLDITIASPANPTIFDNAATMDREVSSERLALTLMCCQCFSTSGTIGVAKWNDKPTPGNGSSLHAPCIPSGMLHAFLIGESLLKTIWLNLIDKEFAQDVFGKLGFGKPVWEQMVVRENDKEAKNNATATYLGRMMPLARSIRLADNRRSIILANGLPYPQWPVFREPAATFVKEGEEYTWIGASAARGIWRELSAITVKRLGNKDAVSGPLALRNAPEKTPIKLWIGALLPHPTKSALIIDLFESAYCVPPGMLHKKGQQLYEEGVKLAEGWASGLSYSIQCYWLLRSKSQQPGVSVSKLYADATKALKNQVRKQAASGEQHFWTAIEQHVPVLLKLADKPEEAGDLKMSAWGVAVKKAAEASFEFACPHQTPRQIQAHAIGLQQLFLPKPKDPSAPAKKPSKPKKPA